MISTARKIHKGGQGKGDKIYQQRVCNCAAQTDRTEKKADDRKKQSAKEKNARREEKRK